MSPLINGRGYFCKLTMNNTIKLYAAYKSGYLGENIIDAYFPFAANIMLENNIKVVRDTEIAEKFKERYKFELPLPFIRQILNTGLKNGSIFDYNGEYSTVFAKLSSFRFDSSDFDLHWKKLIASFCEYSNLSSSDAENIILSYIDESSELILSEDRDNNITSNEKKASSWYEFIKAQAQANEDIYNFIAALSLSNITQQALFFTGEARPDYSDLNIYLDSPMVFALLEMDIPERTMSYKQLISAAQKAGCLVHVLDNNYSEIEGIINNAISLIRSGRYDMSKANNVARFFYDSGMSTQDMTEFAVMLPQKLEELGVTIKSTSYEISSQQQFQEDEKVLYDMIKERYISRGYSLEYEEHSIRVDVRSIIMIYRERLGEKASTIRKSRHLMLTSNNMIANVSREYERKHSITPSRSHIPACISSDLFGTVLWLDSPADMIGYQKQKLLADCYSYLRPDRKLLEKYVHELNKARKSKQITDEEFLLMRSYNLVNVSLMDVTNGDYANFNSRTVKEIYHDIQAKADKKHQDEIKRHELTREKLDEQEQKNSELQAENSELRDEIKNAYERKIKFWGNILTLFLIGIPYLTVLVLVDIQKALFSGEVSLDSFLRMLALILTTIIAGCFFDTGRNFCFRIAQKFVKYLP